MFWDNYKIFSPKQFKILIELSFYIFKSNTLETYLKVRKIVYNYFF